MAEKRASEWLWRVCPARRVVFVGSSCGGKLLWGAVFRRWHNEPGKSPARRPQKWGSIPHTADTAPKNVASDLVLCGARLSRAAETHTKKRPVMCMHSAKTHG